MVVQHLDLAPPLLAGGFPCRAPIIENYLGAILLKLEWQFLKRCPNGTLFLPGAIQEQKPATTRARDLPAQRAGTSRLIIELIKIGIADLACELSFELPPIMEHMTEGSRCLPSAP